MNMPLTIRTLIDERAAQYPDKPFLLAAAEDDQHNVFGPAGALTFGQLQDDCRLLEERFRDAGLQPGDVVSVFMGNGIQTARLLLAAMYSGLIAHPLNLVCQPSQVCYIVEHSDTRMIFVSSETRETIVTALASLREQGVTREIALAQTEPDALELPDELPVVLPVALRALAPLEPALAEAVGVPSGAEQAARTANSAHAVYAETPDTSGLSATETPSGPHLLSGDSIALLMYTSGTTGAPKGVLLSHRNLLANARNISAEHQLGGDDRVLAALPLYHINGLVVTLLAPLFHAGSVVMTSRFSARTFWRDVARYHCTWINVVPTIVAYLLNNDEACAMDLSALKFCRSASAALPADHHRAFEARFGIGIIETMGMTETAAPVFSNPYDMARRRVGSVGLPSGSEAKVIARDGSECAPNICGELVLRGDQVMGGYYKRPEETRAAFTADGWLRTGDLGYRDDEGYFYINGRAKELIIKGGENIAPREIDEALLRHPGVRDAAAVGVPDSAYGQEIIAFVVPRDAEGGPPLDMADLRAHCLRELGRFKTPKEFRLIDELPRGPSGKVQRLKLVQT
jgi:long-chain acyl-CoA synthetase